MSNGPASPRHTWVLTALALWVLSAWFPPSVWAETEPLMDKIADILTWVVLVLVPVAGIYLFWMVHILPEKVAEKRHHPQKDAIKTLCILSLIFGGMLWPLAWLWAYSKPVLHQLAYGRDKHEDYYAQEAGNADETPALQPEAAERGKPLAPPNPRKGTS